MKLWPWLFAAGAWGVSAFSPAPEPDLTVLVSGDFKGYLSPCGCVKPMSGGLTRLGQAIRQLRTPQTIVVWAPGLVERSDRQSELKADALAEAAGALQIDAFAPSVADLRLTPPVIQSWQRLSGGRLVHSQLDQSVWTMNTVRSKGEAQIFALTPATQALNGFAGKTAPDPATALRTELDPDAFPIVLWDGDQASARTFAGSIAQGLVLYRSGAKPGNAVETIGKVGLASPGEKGKVLLALTVRQGRLIQQRVIDLLPDFNDDPAMNRIKARYLQRVTEERLLDKIPRLPSAKFAGSKACMSCHQDDYKVWQATDHAAALKTLEDDRHDRDPDCVSCHVVGLDRVGGFVSRQKTKFLADVGCESCHGPSADHVKQPTRKNTRRGSLKDCMSCHNSEHSPGFNAKAYWKKIKH